jgi:arginine transport system substrate-binding protein
MNLRNILLVTLGLASATIISANAQRLTFATEATYPPFVSMTPSGNMVGFDADLTRAVCAQMHATCTLVNAPWDSLIPSLQIGKYDVLFGGMGITAAREKVVSFSKPYYNNTAAIVAMTSTHLSPSPTDLTGKVIGVQGGTTFQVYMQAKYGSTATIKPYASDMQAMLDLQSGRVNAVFLDTPVAVLWMEGHPNSGMTIVKQVNDPAYFGSGNGYAVQKNNTLLVNQLNQAIDALQKNGTLAKLQTQYFGKP